MFVLAHNGLGFFVRKAALASTAASYGNIGYMGLPLSVAFFGSAAGVPAAIVFCIDCTVLFLLTAVFAAERGQGGSSLVVRIMHDIATHPFIVATVLGMLASAFAIRPYGALATIFNMLAGAAGPTALFALGLTVGLRPFTGLKPDSFVVAVVSSGWSGCGRNWRLA
jgi:malonate transporter and related proteins